MIPDGVTRPCSAVARSTWPQVAPPPTRTVFEPGSTATSAIPPRSITIPSSTEPRPPPLCPPPRTATGRLWLAPEGDAARDLLGVEHRTTIAGRLSIIPL